MRIILLVGAVGILASCTYVYGPDSQYIVVATDPPGADCVVRNNIADYGHVVPTPDGVEVQKSPDPLIVSCSTQEIYVTSNPEMGAPPGDVGGMQFGGLVGVAVVPPTGPDHHYESPVLIKLHPPAPQ